MAAPIVTGIGRRFFVRNILLATGLGLVLAEAFWRLRVKPRRKRRDEFFEARGVKYEKPFDTPFPWR